MKRIFDWDPKKAIINQKKHKVTFNEAVGIFIDPFILSKFDADHSEAESRWISLGISEFERCLLVVHTEREIETETEIVRLISARRATLQEEQYYRARRPL